MFKLSDNAKTGKSLNVSRRSCVGVRTAICAETCYGARRDTQSPCVLAGRSTPNTGPITRPRQQEVYEENLIELERMGMEGSLAEGAARVAQYHTDLRICGLGDLTLEIVDLCVHLALAGCKPWGFSRNALMLVEMAALCDAVGIEVGHPCRPRFAGSIDVSTPGRNISALMAATKLLNGTPRLGLMARSFEEYIFVTRWPMVRASVAVIFGYHATGKKTRLSVIDECPATAGEDVLCHDCRRCIDG